MLVGLVYVQPGRLLVGSECNCFASVELTSQPSIAAGGQAQLRDVGREGRPCLVQFSPGLPAGFHARTHEGGWGSFRPFALQPNVDFRDPNVRMIDLSGDGLDDVLVTNHCLHIWFPSLGTEGWDKAREMAKTYDQERGPSAVFADVSGAVFVADMTGDGLPDIVRIWNGNICYWP